MKMQRTIGGVVAALAIALSGCATVSGSEYETVSAGEVAEFAAGKSSQRAQALKEWEAASDQVVVTYPAACARKECGPKALYHNQLRQAALLMSAVEMLDEVAQVALSGIADPIEAHDRVALVRDRLPVLRSRVAAVRLELEDSGLPLEEFESLRIAHEQLQRAEKISVRLLGQIAGEGRPASGGTPGELTVAEK